MNASILKEKYINTLHILAKFKQEQNVVDECFNRSLQHDSVQIHIAPTEYVNIQKNLTTVTSV